jgi:glycosyltransferase involved in cell wall biosynthesis
VNGTVLQVASQLEGRGGIGRVVAGGSRALAARGIAVHVAGPRADDDDLAAFGDLPLHILPKRRTKILALVDLVPLVRRLRPQVVHFHSAMPHGEVIAALRLLRAAPVVVVTPHSSRPYAKRRARLGVRAADLVVAPSDWAAMHARAAGARRVEVSHPGIDAGTEPDLDERDPTVLALGRLAATKGFDTLLDAFDACAATRPAWRLWIAGEGAARAALEARARALTCADRVHFLGWIAGDAKADALARAAIGVLPSRRESFGAALLEMQARGLACIASDAGALPEIAAHGRAARLFSNGDADALAAALGALMDDARSRRNLAAAGRANALEFTWTAYAARIEALYRDALAR